MTSVAIFAEAMLGYGLYAAERGEEAHTTEGQGVIQDGTSQASEFGTGHSYRGRGGGIGLAFDFSFNTLKMGLDTKSPLVPQVGGHPGVSISEDGSLLIKPALAHEVEFYQHLNSEPAFASLRSYIPKFYGTLRFEGKVEGGNLETLREAPKGGKDKCLYLGKSGDRPCIYNNHTFDSIGESGKYILEAEHPRH